MLRVKIAGAVNDLPRGIDRCSFIFGPPPSDCVEVFQREADWIHQSVAAGAGLIGTVLSHTLPHRQNLTCGTIILQRRHIWWWRGRRNSISFYNTSTSREIGKAIDMQNLWVRLTDGHWLVRGKLTVIALRCQ